MMAYLEACPSTSFSLRDLGSGLPQWLERNDTFAQPHSRLALDMARLEWAHIEAFDAASFPALTSEEMALISEATELQLQPHIRLLEFAYPVDNLLIEIRHGNGGNDISSNNAVTVRKTRFVGRVATLAPEQIYLAVHRQQFMVYYKRLKVEEYRMLKALQCGMQLGPVLEAGFENSSILEGERGAFLQQAFHDWAVLGWLSCPEAAGLRTVPSADVQ